MPHKRESKMIAVSLNGSLYQDEGDAAPRLSVTDRGFLLGDGLFETLPILGGHPLWWPEHLARLRRAAKWIGLPLNEVLIDEMLVQMCKESAGQNAILRFTISRGSGGRGLLPPDMPKPTVLATLTPLPERLAFEEMSLVTSTIRRNETSPTSQIKSLTYLDNILAARQAGQSKADDALMLNTSGNVACSTIGNLFALYDDLLVTPPCSDGCLPGILRQNLLTLAPEWGFRVKTASLTPQELKKADGLIMTNSLRIIRRVSRLDSHPYDPSRNKAIGCLQQRMRDEIEKQTRVSLT
ncbi:aminodeoxychorismate lyase [uncultured Cohaesibacter sp.]|uniref:aminotransferase class IV n=1 Tax=uncultured Cohaesibacter sp. TaxID=1002546 RepID=UPI002930231B|nr:aminodeoxychorismate lyase [uncultured Cohaesibacter sp.]